MLVQLDREAILQLAQHQPETQRKDRQASINSQIDYDSQCQRHGGDLVRAVFAVWIAVGQGRLAVGHTRDPRCVVMCS